jgi:uncharacterized membrane protein
MRSTPSPTPPLHLTSLCTPSTTTNTNNADDNNNNPASFDSSSWIIAVGLAIFAAICNNIGVNIQKLAWTRKQRHVDNYQLWWLLGMLLIALASVFDFTALAFGPQSVIAPLGALTMVCNAYIAPAMHGEKLSRLVFISTVIIVAGCAISVMAASHDNIICTIDTLFALYWTKRFYIYAFIFFAIVISTLLFLRRADRLSMDKSLSNEYARVYAVHRIGYAFLSGLFGAQSVLFARTVSEMIVGSVRGGRMFLAYPGTYAVVMSLVLCIVLQIYFLNIGLSRFESLYNVPTFTSTWIVGTAIGGAVFYGEVKDFTLKQAILFPLGVCTCVIGVLLLSFGDQTSSSIGDGNKSQPSPPPPTPPPPILSSISTSATNNTSIMSGRNQTISNNSSMYESDVENPRWLMHTTSSDELLLDDDHDDR